MAGPSLGNLSVSPEGNVTVAVTVAFGLGACMGQPSFCLWPTLSAMFWLGVVARDVKLFDPLPAGKLSPKMLLNISFPVPFSAKSVRCWFSLSTN